MLLNLKLAHLSSFESRYCCFKWICYELIAAVFNQWSYILVQMWRYKFYSIFIKSNWICFWTIVNVCPLDLMVFFPFLYTHYQSKLFVHLLFQLFLKCLNFYNSPGAVIRKSTPIELKSRKILNERSNQIIIFDHGLAGQKLQLVEQTIIEGLRATTAGVVLKHRPSLF